MVLSKLFGSGDFQKIKDLNLPRLGKFTRRDIKTKFNQLEKKHIILRKTSEKNKFFINNDIGRVFWEVYCCTKLVHILSRLVDRVPARSDPPPPFLS